MKIAKYNKKGKYILGINGWNQDSHDAAVSLVEVFENRYNIVGCIEEEKSSGNKCAYDSFPKLAINDLLNSNSLTVQDIDYVVFGWDYVLLGEKKGEKVELRDIVCNLFNTSDISHIDTICINHHLAHAASSYRVSGFNEALSVVIDGNGETESFSIWKSKNGELIPLYSAPMESSFGFLFEATNIVVGFQNYESGKTMGLAAYGKPIYANEIMKMYGENSIEMTNEFVDEYRKVSRFIISNEARVVQDSLIKTWLSIFLNKLGIKRNKKKIDSYYNIDKKYKDLAASVQYVLEHKVTNEIRKWMIKENLVNVCLSGGVALNCTLNGKILEMPEVEKIFVQPAAGDSGVALGAALEQAYRMGAVSKMDKEFSPYLGIEYTSDEIVKFCEKYHLKFRIKSDASYDIAKALCQGKVVGIFQGRNEWGPRALGNRSIISLPNKEKLDFINMEVKQRELGRPLGPSLLETDYRILNDKNKQFGRYMNIAYQLDNSIEDRFGAVIHIDKSFRPQYVTESSNISFYHQLRELKKQIGNSIVINTSFNLATPIVYSLEQVLSYFKSKRIDWVVFNNEIIIEKENN